MALIVNACRIAMLALSIDRCPLDVKELAITNRYNRSLVPPSLAPYQFLT